MFEVARFKFYPYFARPTNDKDLESFELPWGGKLSPSTSMQGRKIIYGQMERSLYGRGMAELLTRAHAACVNISMRHLEKAKAGLASEGVLLSELELVELEEAYDLDRAWLLGCKYRVEKHHLLPPSSCVDKAAPLVTSYVCAHPFFLEEKHLEFEERRGVSWVRLNLPWHRSTGDTVSIMSVRKSPWGDFEEVMKVAIAPVAIGWTAFGLGIEIPIARSSSESRRTPIAARISRRPMRLSPIVREQFSLPEHREQIPNGFVVTDLIRAELSLLEISEHLGVSPYSAAMLVLLRHARARLQPHSRAIQEASQLLRRAMPLAEGYDTWLDTTEPGRDFLTRLHEGYSDVSS